MKKSTLALLLVMVGLPTVSPAKGYRECKILSDISFVSNEKLAKDCGDHILGIGTISRGDNKGRIWKDTYTNHKFKNYDDYDNVTVIQKNPTNTTTKLKQIFKIKGKDSLRTKQLEPLPMMQSLSKQGLKLVSWRVVPIGWLNGE